MEERENARLQVTSFSDWHAPLKPKAEPKPNEASRDYQLAKADALSVMRWWHSHGFVTVKAWPEPRPVQGKSGMTVAWGVRSNLVGGLPAGVAPRDVVRAISEQRAKINARMDSLGGFRAMQIGRGA